MKDLIIEFCCDVDSKLEHECDKFGHDYVAFSEHGRDGPDLVEVEKVCEWIAVAKCVHLFITLPDGPWNDLKNQTPAAYRKSLKERTKSMKLLTNADQLAECVRCHGGTKPLLGMISAMVGRGKTLCSLCKHMS